MARRSVGKARPGSWRALRLEDLARPVRSMPVTMRAGSVRVLGLDPGSVKTGYGIVDTDGPAVTCVAHGAIQIKNDDFAARLRQIHSALLELLERYQPDEVAIERVFVSRNVDSALKLGQARGAALAAVPATTRIHEYAPRAVKMAVVGTGGAEKHQVQHMVVQLLGLASRPTADAADALALAVCHANHRRLGALEPRAAAG